MDKVVVLGGAGFMGTHTADELIRRGYHVVIYDLEKPEVSRDCEFVSGDILDGKRLTEIISGAKFVYHFAGIADIEESSLKPEETIKLNVLGAVSALNAARSANVSRFLYASTMYVYSPFGSFYRASKQSAEIIIEAYNKHYGLNYTLLRYGSLYGPRAQEWNGLKKYVSQIVRNECIRYPGTGEEQREYIHVFDAARLTVDALIDQYRNAAVTITGSQSVRSKDLLSMIFEIANIPTKVNFSSEPTNEFHYGMTPYRYTPKPATKMVPAEYVDLGQGILDLVEEAFECLEDSEEKITSKPSDL